MYTCSRGKYGNRVRLTAVSVKVQADFNVDRSRGRRWFSSLSPERRRSLHLRLHFQVRSEMLTLTKMEEGGMAVPSLESRCM